MSDSQMTKQVRYTDGSYSREVEEVPQTSCTCYTPFYRANDIDPPEPKLDPWCPEHGKDPDDERQKLIDRRNDE